jgi:hypothetical protein
VDVSKDAWKLFQIAGIILIGVLALFGMASAAPAPGETSISSAPGWSGNIREFVVRDLPYWRSGRWVRDVHEGRGGWWWVIDQTWYPYAQVTYPFPDPFTPSPYKQPTILGESDVQVPASAFYWYYCAALDEFYPYAVACESGWSKVRAP